MGKQASHPIENYTPVQPSVSFIPDVLSRRTALHLAAQNNKTAAIEMLVGKGLHVDVKDKKGMTPFLEAAAEGHDESLRVLLRLGANLHQTTSTRSHHGSSALILAANNGYDKAE